jgi:hypothetical protein
VVVLRLHATGVSGGLAQAGGSSNQPPSSNAITVNLAMSLARI